MMKGVVGERTRRCVAVAPRTCGGGWKCGGARGTRAVGLFLVAGLLGCMTGCAAIRAMFYYLSPPHIQKAQYRLTEGRLAIVIDYARPDDEHPVFSRRLHDGISARFAEHKVKSQVIPFDEMLALRQMNRDYGSWTIQRIGREAEADEVLYVRVSRLQFLEEPGHPVVSASVSLSVKVIGTQQDEAHARLWPTEEREGKPVSCGRPSVEAGRDTIDVEAAKLATDTSYLVAGFFHDVDLEEKPPKER